VIEPAARPMVERQEVPLQTACDTRRAALDPWKCDGMLRDGRPCCKTLMELDWGRPSYIRKVCERCGHINVFVEAYRPV
jgi:hypothetical protein